MAVFELSEAEIRESVVRIRRMELLFDEVTAVLRERPEEVGSADVREAIETLSEYLECGDYMRDYELDEAHLLPSELKRGVLSQDGLYDLLTLYKRKKYTHAKR